MSDRRPASRPDRPANSESTLIDRLEEYRFTPRGAIAVAMAVMAVTFALVLWLWLRESHQAGDHSDAGQLWAAARALIAGRDPYAEIGPGRTFEWRFELFYPLTAAIPFLPLAPLGEHLADALWSALGAGSLAWALASRRQHAAVGLLGLIGMPMLYAMHTSQWSPFLTAAIEMPALAALGAFAVCKPNFGLGVACGAHTGRWRGALLGAAVIVVVSFAFRPTWPRGWLDALRGAEHIHPAIFKPGGFLLLLALLRWRRWEARLLLGLSCIPQSPFFNDVLPLVLIPTRAFQQVLIGASGVLGAIWWDSTGYGPTYVVAAERQGLAVLYACMLPTLLIVMCRPNEGDVPPAIERLATRLPAWARGRRATLDS